jgi:hypothetical protein
VQASVPDGNDQPGFAERQRAGQMNGVGCAQRAGPGEDTRDGLPLMSGLEGCHEITLRSRQRLPPRNSLNKRSNSMQTLARADSAIGRVLDVGAYVLAKRSHCPHIFFVEAGCDQATQRTQNSWHVYVQHQPAVDARGSADSFDGVMDVYIN